MSKSVNSLMMIAVFVFVLSATARAETFYAYLNSAQEVPANASTATGYARVFVNEAAGTMTFTVVFNGLSSAQTASHIHAPAPIGANAGIIINFGAVGGTSGTINGTANITPAQLAQVRQHQGYVNVHTANFPGGEIRGQLGIKRPVDFDGDGRQDYSILRFPNVAPPGVANSTYYNLNSSTGFQGVQWGDANRDFPTPGDYDGDGKDDFSLYRAGASAGAQSVFCNLLTLNNTVQCISWGVFGDIAVNRDYDGDGKTDIAVFRRGASAGSPAIWYIKQSATGTDRAGYWGTTGGTVNDIDVPVPGDYDGDGKFDLAVYRAGALTPANHFIILRSSDNTALTQQWGNFTSDYIVPGDYDGDGKFDFAAARTGATSTSQMTWYILQTSNNQTRITPFGITSDVPAQGDYDGDARTDIAVYRAGATTGASSTFFVLNSLNNTFQATSWGVRPDFAIATFDAR